MSQQDGRSAAQDPAQSDAESAAAALAALEEPKPRRRLTWRWLLLIVLALLVITLAALPLLRPLIHTVVNGNQPTAQSAIEPGAAHMAALEQRLAMMERRLQSQPPPPDLSGRIASIAENADALQQQVARLEQELAGLAEVESRLAKFEQKLAAMDKAVQDGAGKTGGDPELANRVAAQGKDIAALNAEMERLQGGAQTLGADARKIALVMALNQLAATAEHTGSYAIELRAVQDLVRQNTPGSTESDPALTALQGHAASGVATLAALQTGFARAAGAIVRAGDAPTESDWWSHTLRRLASLVTIRRTGEVAGASPEAVVARAEQRLAAGDLAAAVQEVEKLTGGSAAAAAEWLTPARANLAVVQAVENLRARTLAGIGGGAPKPKSPAQ
jgi:hypothetical protein